MSNHAAVRGSLVRPTGLVLAVSLLCAGTDVRAQVVTGGATAALKDKKQAREKDVEQAQAAEKRLREMRRAAGKYALELNSNPAVPLTLLPEPVLRWTNPLRITFDGAIFLWLANGRPAVAMSVFRKHEGGGVREDHEFQSLAPVGVTASYGGIVRWAPDTAGITFVPVPGAPEPAKTAPARLRQMRALALEFRGETHDRTPTPLRLLTKPLYRYETSGGDCVDGALFAFVFATDPEVLLLIEARLLDDKLVWHYGLGRMSGRRLQVWHQAKRVQEFPWLNGGRSESYVRLPAPEPPE
jgi:hypothetical protein